MKVNNRAYRRLGRPVAARLRGRMPYRMVAEFMRFNSSFCAQRYTEITMGKLIYRLREALHGDLQVAPLPDTKPERRLMGKYRL